MVWCDNQTGIALDALSLFEPLLRCSPPHASLKSGEGLHGGAHATPSTTAGIPGSVPPSLGVPTSNAMTALKMKLLARVTIAIHSVQANEEDES